MSTNLAILPISVYKSRGAQPSFWGKKSPDSEQTQKKLPDILIQTPKKLDPVSLPGVSYYMAQKIVESANKSQLSVDDFLRQYLKHLTYTPQILPEPSKSAIVGKTKVTTLIDGGQIFDRMVADIRSAKNSIQIEMFEFQNLKVDGDIWPANGADVVPGFEQQQNILPILIKKKKENPDIKIQVILDAHKWYINGNNEKERHYNNQKMIRYLLENGIDVVPYPRAAQQGAALQHVKLVAVDGKKIIIGGMNMGTHSSANHDACVAIETLPKYKNSEVDNIIEEIFNKDWKFSWQRLGHTKLVAGPLSKEEQENYSGLKKEIKEENVVYMNIVGQLYNKPECLNRYDDKDLSKLDLIKTSPVANPKIKIMATKPHELKFVKEEGKETTREHLLERLKTSSKVRGELFVLSDKEIIQTIVERYKRGELDAKFIVSSDILEEFPYCRMAYNELISNNVPVRLYNFDEKINQRMHAKWAIFDDREVVIGSTNWSAMGLNQNLKKGMREDYELHAAKIDEEIAETLKEVKEFEDLIGIPPLSRKRLDYKEVIARRKILKSVRNSINKVGVANANFQNKTCKFSEADVEYISKVQGYYNTIKDCYNSKEKYKRGNNECAISFDKPSLAAVFLRQFEKDWRHSESDFEKIKEKVLLSPKEPSSNLDLVV